MMMLLLLMLLLMQQVEFIFSHYYERVDAREGLYWSPDKKRRALE